MNLTYEENDRVNAPYLLSCSFQGLIQFLGSENKNGVLHWKFAPADTAKILIKKLNTKTDPNIPAIDVISAVNLWWKEVAELKRSLYGSFSNK